MAFSWFQLIFFALCAIIPAMIVLVVCNAQIQTLKGDLTRNVLLLENKASKLDDKVVLIDQLNKSATDAAAESHKATLRVENLDESLRSLSNKLSVRERDRKRAETRDRKEKEEMENENFIPGTEQQTLPFPEFPVNLDQPKGRIPPKRKFGTVP